MSSITRSDLAHIEQNVKETILRRLCWLEEKNNEMSKLVDDLNASENQKEQVAQPAPVKDEEL
jgi:hypothetical protein